MKYFLILLFLFINSSSISQENWTYLIGDDLSNWEIKQGQADFKIVEGTIVGTSQIKSASTYQTTKTLLSARADPGRQEAPGRPQVRLLIAR